MKTKVLLIGLLSLVMTLPMMAQNKVQKLGLVSELAYIKYSSEWVVAELLTYRNLLPKDSIKMVTYYYTVLSTVNQFICQLQADMASNNSVTTYKKIDNLLKKSPLNNACHSKNKKIRRYIEALQVIQTASDSCRIFYETTTKALQTTRSSDEKRLTAALAIMSTASGILSTNVGIVKNIQEMKITKVTGISTILEKLKISAPSELFGSTESAVKQGK
jgi:hypothetical protein